MKLEKKFLLIGVLFIFIIISGILGIYFVKNKNISENEKVEQSLEKFQYSNNIKQKSIISIKDFNKDNKIVIWQSTKDDVIFSIIHKHIFKGWRVETSTSNGFVKNNTIVYTSAPKYNIGIMIGSIKYDNNIKSIKIDNKKVESIIFENNIIFFIYTDINKLMKENMYYKPNLNIEYKNNKVFNNNGWEWNLNNK